MCSFYEGWGSQVPRSLLITGGRCSARYVRYVRYVRALERGVRARGGEGTEDECVARTVANAKTVESRTKSGPYPSSLPGLTLGVCAARSVRSVRSECVIYACVT